MTKALSQVHHGYATLSGLTVVLPSMLGVTQRDRALQWSGARGLAVVAAALVVVYLAVVGPGIAFLR